LKRVPQILAISVAGLAVLAVALVAIAAMARTATDAWGRAYVLDDRRQMPKVDTVLVLGAIRPDDGPRTVSSRIDSAAGLWHAGQADRFLVSGTAMRDELVARGVPSSVIELDHESPSLWDSLSRARHVFGKRRLLIVAQRDQLGQALFLARHAGIETWGVAARGVAGGFYDGLRAYYDVLKGPAPGIIAAARPR
jgi:vancomycin permeability regulator SanA